MVLQAAAGITVLHFENLRRSGLVHGVFARRGGVSPAPWGTLNAGSLVGDSPDCVAENLRRAADVLQRHPESLVTVRQVHGSDVRRIDAPPPGNTIRRQIEPAGLRESPAADAMITNSPETTLFMRFADCVPVILYDPVRKAAGIAHAGWRGSIAKVAGRAVSSLVSEFGTRPGDVLAGIGPSICAAHYEVGPELVQAVRAAFGPDSERVVNERDGRFFLDLRLANRLALEAAGVIQIEVSGACTAEDPTLWFSHRGEKGATGRFSVLVGLEGARARS